jgi:hypothetical protein
LQGERRVKGDEVEGGGEAVVEHGVGEGGIEPCLCEEVDVVEEDYDSVLGDGLVEGRGDGYEGGGCSEGVCAGFGADDGDEAFGGDVVDCLW